MQWVLRTRIMKLFMASRLYQVYQSVSGWGWTAS
jgi:hypothetical protein